MQSPKKFAVVFAAVGAAISSVVVSGFVGSQAIPVVLAAALVWAMVCATLPILRRLRVKAWTARALVGGGVILAVLISVFRIEESVEKMAINTVIGTFLLLSLIVSLFADHRYKRLRFCQTYRRGDWRVSLRTRRSVAPSSVV